MNNSNKKQVLFGAVIIALALVLMVIGYNRKEYETYFTKAIQICTQCIGIGQIAVDKSFWICIKPVFTKGSIIEPPFKTVRTTVSSFEATLVGKL